MLVRLMKYYIPLFFKRFSVALLVSSALGSTALTAALAQSLPDIHPEQIAEDVERRFDERTGETEYVGGSFDPFEADTAIAGSASLRSAGKATTLNGDIVLGGAFLDIAAVYTTASPDSFDVRGFEQVDFMSGQPSAIIRYDNKTLDCSRSTREVTYDDSYYRGASYGYVAGLYRIFPRYRGHRQFGWNRSTWRRGTPRYFRHGRNSITTHGLRGGRADNRSDQRREDRSRRRGPRDNDAATPRTPRHGTAGTENRNSDSNTGATQRRDNRRNARDRLRDQNQNGNTEARQNRRDARARSRNELENRNNREARENRRDTETNRERPPRHTSGPRDNTTRAINRSELRNNSARVARPDRSAEPRRSRPIERAATRPERTITPQANPRPARQEAPARVNRAVDKAFKAKNPRPKTKERRNNFFPMVGGYARTDVYVNYRCVKEEILTVHIPQERLEAARFDGFAVLLIDNAGREVPVFVPPNYVEGFRIAVGDAGPQPARGYPVPQSAIPAPQKRPNTAPIIYGDLGGPQ